VEETKSLSRSSVLRFGVFQVNLAARELRKHGVRVRLPGQPFCILSMLLEKPGEIVTREEMRQRLWASDTFVDFEHSLNTAIKKLRAALNDSPENSRYIETVPRSGYRFIAPVEAIRAATEAVSASNEPIAPQERDFDLAPKKAGRTHMVLAVAAVCIVILFLALGLTYFPVGTPHVISTNRLTRSGRIDDWGTLVTDGSRIYYLERDGGHWNLMQTSVQGGGSQPVGATLPGSNARILDISRDLSEFLIGTFLMRDTEMPLWALPAQGGAPRRIGNIQARYAVWTPDGKGILYTQGRNLMLADSNGGNSRKFLTASGRASGVAYSPDGRIIRFSTENAISAKAELWETSSDGSSPHRLALNWTNSEGECCGGWTPDGRYYVFLAWKGGKLGVWAVREQPHLLFWRRNAPVNLISGPTPFDNLTLSHDGKRIFALELNPEGDVMRYDHKSRRLISLPGLPHNNAVFYCPTDQWIMYQSDADFSLWRSKADGSQPLQLTGPLLRLADPQWSPDATQIAYMGAGDGLNRGTQVFVVPRDGGDPRRLLRERAWQFHPQWLPDGKSVAISVSPLEGEQEPKQGIYVAEVATQQSYKLPDSQDINSVAWSPDGHFVAGDTQDYHRIKLYDLRKKEWTDIASATLVGGLLWAADSQSLYYQDILEEDEPIYRIWLSSRRREKVYDFHKQLSSAYFRCVMYGLKSDGSLLIHLMRSSSDVYAFDIDFP
jgi:Tol biopolymer transport system component/DNA-binding winged helix-turn-helix (wHTH) protein